MYNLLNLREFMLASSDTTSSWWVNIFTFIGVVFCALVALIVIVWFTCFAVKLLIKTFNTQISKSYDVLVEDISKKTEFKKIRNQKKREEAEKHKMELLELKLENQQKIHDMKKAKLMESLNQKEEKAKEKYGFLVKTNELKDEEILSKTETLNNDEIEEFAESVLEVGKTKNLKKNKKETEKQTDIKIKKEITSSEE